MWRRIAVVTGVAVALGPMVIGTPAAQAVGSQNVIAVALTFVPPVAAPGHGVAVRFVNKDVTAHTLTSNDGLFDTGTVRPQQAVSIPTTGLAAGRYEFHCRFHVNMAGVLVIR